MNKIILILSVLVIVISCNDVTGVNKSVEYVANGSGIVDFIYIAERGELVTNYSVTLPYSVTLLNYNYFILLCAVSSSNLPSNISVDIIYDGVYMDSDNSIINSTNISKCSWSY